jgi:ATP-dependent helicase/nuclease subunit A
MTLTQAQKKAVQAFGKNVLVSAGAGTGKTRVLVERVLQILKTQKALVTELLILTFTEKAANEIKIRLSGGCRKAGLERPRRDLERSAISTFHAFASRLLKEHPIEAGVDPDFRVVEAEEAGLLKEEAMQETVVRFHKEKNDAFELFSVYGEEKVREGVFKIFTAARHEGKSVAAFFLESAEKEKTVCAQREKTLPEEAMALLAKLPEIDAKIWERFFSDKDWRWETFRDFKEWSGLFKGKRKEGWKEWRALLEDLAALRITPLAGPWKKRLEALALAFEAAYTAKKKEKGFLDFDDLQMKAVELFRAERPPLVKLRQKYQDHFKFILVDEFQDTNFLQMEFIELLSSGANLFMVGDYKQSIYGFRGAESGIFRAKEKLYGSGEKGECIFLSESFRSDPPVLDFVNRFFKILWEEDSFPFEPLSASTPQRPGLSRRNPPSEGVAQEPAVELLVTELREKEDMDRARMREAGAIASRIRDLHDKEKIPYGDIAILFQAMTPSGIYEDAFKSAGIPYFIVAGRGFYEQPEIQDVMSFLSHLDRPLADIPLAATLRSPFFHITDDTLFWLSRFAKSEQETTPLFYALKELDRIANISGEQRARLQSFLQLSQELSALKDRIRLSELFDKILEKTGYELLALLDPKGVRRYANLKKLMAMMRGYETYERMPLCSFLNILKRLRTQEVRESEAQIALESSAKAVRMMSVHAAKGLEFPVVFIADMGHQGSRSDSKKVIAHAADGYAVQVSGGGTSETEKTYFFKEVDRAVMRREVEEWKRLFYVAATRARSRIFLSGVHKKKKQEKESFREMTSWMDWAVAICEGMAVKVSRNPAALAAFKHKKKDDLRGPVETFLKEMKQESSSATSAVFAGKEPALLRSIDLPVSAYALFQKDPDAFWRVYQIGWVAKERENINDDPVLEESEFSAADFGIAMHGFLEHLDFGDPARSIEPEILERIFGRFGSEALREAQKIIRGFLDQPVFRSLQKARQVKREIDFVLNGRRGLIHGKIDILFQDAAGRWHILDYKTAAGDEAAARQSAYDLQLEIYALAAERILKVPVCSAIIYYLKNQKAVTLSFPKEEGPAFFDGLEKKVQGLQQQILDDSNKRMTAAAA